jgi:hypothetical protein
VSSSYGYRRERNKLLAIEMGYLGKSYRRVKLDRIRNETTREMIEMEKDVTDEVQKQQLMWFGHTKRMEKARWLRNVLEWVQQEKSKRGRPRRSWRDGVKEAMETRDRAEGHC